MCFLFFLIPRITFKTQSIASLPFALQILNSYPLTTSHSSLDSPLNHLIQPYHNLNKRNSAHSNIRNNYIHRLTLFSFFLSETTTQVTYTECHSHTSVQQAIGSAIYVYTHPENSIFSPKTHPVCNCFLQHI